MFKTIKRIVLGLSFAAAASAASAATVNGAQCGNKYIGLSQNGIELTATLCETGNSTGGPNSPIAQLGWTDSAEYQGSSNSTVINGPVSMVIYLFQNGWSLLDPLGYSSLGISVKQGNGFAFYELDVNAPLSGMWFTGNNQPPTGNSISHINAWYMGSPNVPTVPLPASGLLLLAGFAGMGVMRRRKPAA